MTRPRILIVDDEAEILVALRDLFEDDYDILASTSPLEALDLVAAHPDIAVIISDQRMPELPGNQFLARARAILPTEAILLTGYADLSAVISAVNDGAISGYAHKPWEAGSLRAMVAAAAERHGLRAAVAFERAAFAALAERSPLGIALVDRAHRTLRANALATCPLPGDPIDAADEEALAEGRYSEEECHWPGTGGDRWTRIRRIPFGDKPDARHLLRIEIDETDRRIAEQRMHQAEKLQALGTLAGGIAHDFNNLLAVILGNLELAMARRDDPVRLERYLANAREAATRGSTVSRRLLAFTRQRDLAAETFDPAEALRGIEELIVRAMAGRVTLRIEASDTVGAVRCDPGQLELAIVNLCINARDAMPDGGEIRIQTRIADGSEVPAELGDGPFVAISVIDTGVGMDAALQARVFEPFFTTKPRGEGTGLGLPMARSMTRALGGDVVIASTPGAGTRVTLLLPLTADTLTAAAGDDNVAPMAPQRILLVEDDPGVAAMLADQLGGSGHTIVESRSANRALQILETDAAFDLLITDFAMPERSGIDLARDVADRWPQLPILLITGFAEVEGGLPDLAVLSKPFTAEQLSAALVRALARAPGCHVTV
ncbi:response regulator [Sphingomonas sp. 1P06PA]|uniref:response regulator n=1 Tax=Sphingomonas sp. 1P06PA TaxID=554121 RepID=UPI0039A4AF94